MTTAKGIMLEVVLVAIWFAALYAMIKMGV